MVQDKIKIILVEDHALVREGITAMIEREADMECIACYSSGEIFLNGLKIQNPDVILMDISLPDISGIELCKKIKTTYPHIFVLALSINNHPAIIRQMMNSGADGYLLKDADRREIITGIRTVIQGTKFYSQSVIETLRTSASINLPPLTRREREVLQFIAEGLGRQEIASRLCIDITTVDSHRKNMLAKYNATNTSALIKLVITEGMIEG
ncbi:MAG: response regulator transcription factor [Chitinophagaceae bacterium]|jgi:DNA-binding NarL/FixJ family response regulator|nr:response regulator transcription factor [Chitinophagaceae bacterium]